MTTPNEAIRHVSFCPHCGNTAPQKLIHTQRFFEEAWSLKDTSSEKYPWSIFIAICETCHRVLLYDNTGDQHEEKEFNRGELVYPTKGFVHKSVPENIAKVYHEAFRIKQIAPNAFAVQIRRALEAVCQEKGAEKGTLQRRLALLAERGHIPPVLAEASDALRLLGNVGAHGISESVHPLQVYAIDDFFRAIIEYLYVAPSKLAQFKERMKIGRQAKDDDEI